MTVLIDPPNASGHGRLWSHLASDASYDELHRFARETGVPARGFDGDHYDVPAEWYQRMLAAGAVPVSSRELIGRLHAAGLRARKSERLRPRKSGRRLLAPPRLRPGDPVAVVLPGGPVDAGRLAAGMEVLRGWGLQVRAPDVAAHGVLPWLAAADEQRAESLTAAWTSSEVGAVFCGRGGFGCQRLLDLLDWRRLATARPRLLVGFSDVTALHQGFAARLGVATVHAPVVAGLGDGDAGSRESVRRLVMSGRAGPVTGSPGVPGTAEGVLVGGNLTVLASGMGTSHVHPATDSIALLEDAGEQPYRLDRALTQLLRGGWFDGVRGIVLGRFTSCGPPDQVRALLEARLGGLGVPLVLETPIGHGGPNLAVPLGVVARLDGAAGTLSFDDHILPDPS